MVVQVVVVLDRETQVQEQVDQETRHQQAHHKEITAGLEATLLLTTVAVVAVEHRQ
jgi:hypothetical protein